MAGAEIALCLLSFLNLSKGFFRCCSAVGGGGERGGGLGGIRMSFIHIGSMPKALVFTVFPPLGTTHCAR